MSRRVVITGASRGIGFEAAAAFLRRGDEVTITGRSLASLDDAAQKLATLAPLGNLHTISVDSADTAAMIAALEPLKAEVLVSNVGAGFSGSILQTSLEDWHNLLEVNATSAFTAIKVVLPGMLDAGFGRIITVGSMASHQAIKYGVAYTSSKHALLGLTRAVALDVAGKGVTVNMVAPAFVRTDMMIENIERMVAKNGISHAEAESKLAGLSTIGRLIEPEEVADEILRYAAEDAGDLTGQSTTMGFDD
jgi:3-hydroxybutyrate dehydrogenase